MARIARLTGSSFIRPVRLGIALKPTLENVKKAAEWATKCWGGMYFPLLDSSNQERSLAIAEGCDLDAIWPLDDSAGSKLLAKTEGYFWRVWGDGSGPFDPPPDSMPTALLSPDWALSEDGSGPFFHPTWHDNDHLKNLFRVWFGFYKESNPLRFRFSGKSASTMLEIQGRIPSGVVNFRTPISATSLGITYRGAESRVGVMRVAVDDPQSLMHFWNLRASGADVFPWVDGEAHRLLELLGDWFSTKFTSAPTGNPRGDSKEVFYLWGMDQPPSAFSFSSVFRRYEGRYEWRAADSLLHLGWSGHNALSTPFARTYSLQFDSTETRVSVPLPPGPPARYAANSNVGVVAAQIIIDTEVGLKPGIVATAPNLRKYSRLVDTMSNFPGSFERVVYEGRAAAVAVDSHEMEIGFTSSLRLFEQLFKGSSWRVKHTEGGRLASRVIEMLGGVGRYPGNQPAIRRVLDDAAKSTSGKKIPALIRTAQNYQGDWPGLTSIDSSGYCRGVVYDLLQKKLLQPFLEVSCPHCSTKTTVRPESLSSEMECEICSDAFPLGFALGVAPGGKNEWVYRLTGNLSPDRVAEIMPVAATQSVLTDLLTRGVGSMPHVYGVVLEEGKWKCEVDVVAMADGDEKPVVILGEVKSYRDSIDSKDLDNLMRVQEFLESAGVSCFILAATLRGDFSEQEIVDLRHLREMMAAKGSHPPIVLNGRQLSVPRLHSEYPATWDSRFFLSNFARESCERNLHTLGLPDPESGAVRGVAESTPHAGPETGAIPPDVPQAGS